MTDSIPTISPVQTRDWFGELPKGDFEGQRILLVVPNADSALATKSKSVSGRGVASATERYSPDIPGPLPLVFDAFFQSVRPHCLAIDVLMALGNAPPMSDPQISKLLGISERERGRLFFQTQFFNHDPDRADRLVRLGALTSDETADLTRGVIASEIPVEINSRTSDYDLLLVLCPVFPQRSLGYSGGSACFFPGLGGPDILAAINQIDADPSAEQMVGVKDTPIRRLADAASTMIPQARRAITFVARSDGSLCGLFYDNPESAWTSAADSCREIIELTARSKK